MFRKLVIVPLLALFAGPSPADVTSLEAELLATETQFAATMAHRDHEAFISFLATDVVFTSGAQSLRGRDEVASGWAEYFNGETAPFSWEPDFSVVLEGGELGLTSGPVFDQEGKRITTFHSVWQRQSSGTWKIVLDRGCPACPE
jgi:ketosteroid isomerase-like protein